MTLARRTRFNNGFTLLSEENHHAPVVALQAWVNVGAADETDREAGLAHLHEHMLFKGTERRGVGEIARIVEASGGEINAWTSFDQTVFHLVLTADELHAGIDILADTLRNSSFDPVELDREIEVVVEEIRRAQDTPSRRVANALFALAYEQHPYRRPVLGSEATVRSFSRAEILDFYRRHYRPDRITLVAVGDFETDQLVEEVSSLFGGWDPSEPDARVPRPAEAHPTSPRARVLLEPIKESRVALAWHVPGLSHRDVVALDAMSVILGQGDSSRLCAETRRRQELVNDAYAHAYTPRDPGLFIVGAGLRAGNAQDALASLLHETYRLRRELVSMAELERAKVLMLSEAAYHRQTVQGQARKLGFFEVVGGDHAFESTYLQALKQLHPAELRAVAGRYLTEAACAVVQAPIGSDLDDVRVMQVVSDTFEKSRAGRCVRRACGALDVTRVALNNGATVLVRKEKSPAVAMRAIAYGGLRWENAESCGIGNLFSSLWGLATEHHCTGELSHRASMLGGSVSAFAGRNTVGLRGEFIAEKAAEGFDLFVETLLRPTFAAADLERERAVVLERIRNREDSPAGVAFDMFVSALFENHPYGLRVTGTEESVCRFTLDDILAYQRRFVSPDKLVLAVVGDVDVDHVLDVLVQALDRPKGPELPALTPCDGPPARARRICHALDKKQAHVIIGTMGTTVYDSDRHALEVLTMVLSGQSGRLFLDLRDRRGLAYSVSSSSLEGLDPGHLLVHVGTSPDKTAEALEGVYEHLRRLRAEAVSHAELRRAQTYLVGTHAIDLQRAGSRAMTMALNERFALGYDAHTRYAERVYAVTADAVQYVAEHYFDPDRLVEVIVGPGAG